jgi:hypothetical protein
MDNAEPEFLDAVLMSSAGRSVRDPEPSLRRVELGGFQDGIFQDGSTDQLHITGVCCCAAARLALRDMRFTPAGAALPWSLEPHVGNHDSLCEQSPAASMGGP